MPTTRNKISEQIQLFLGGGRNSTAQKAHLYEIRETVGQVINSLLKTEYFNSNIGLGETIPNGLVVATYSDIPVVPYKNVSESILPAFPVKLPLNMGVFMIHSNDDVTNVYIPLQTGDIGMLIREPLISDLLGQVGYEVNGVQVLYNRDLTASGSVSPKVTMKLVVMDISQYSDTDILPIPADMEWTVIQGVCKFYGVEPDPNKIIDSGVKASTVNQIMA